MGQDNRFRFTPARLAKLPAGAAMYYDTATPLALRVTVAGGKTFCVYRRIDGKPSRVRIGRMQDITLQDARNAAQELLGKVAAGGNPAAERKATRKQTTLQEAFSYWLDNHAKIHNRTWRESERVWSKFVAPRLGNPRLASIGEADVTKVHTAIGAESGPYQANRVLSLLSAVFHKARALGYRGENPTIDVKRFHEESRERFLGADELPKFFQTLTDEPDELLRDYFLVGLLTGARKYNTLAMRWSEIDWHAKVWRIPRTKAGKSVTIPLTTPALAVLEQRRLRANGSEWVFPSPRKDGHLADPKAAWGRLVKRAGLQDVRQHDLRRSLASYMAIGNTALPIIAAMLGHASGSRMTAVYARLADSPVRAAAEAATATILQAGGVQLLGGPTDDQA